MNFTTIQTWIKSFLLVIAGLTLLATFSQPVYSANNIDTGSACKGVEWTDPSGATGCTGDSEGSLKSIVRAVVDVLSIIVGAVSVIAIIIGGLRYVTSGGDSTRVSGAKNAILYAVVGLVIVLFAQVLVRFVITEVKDQTTPTNTTQPGNGGAQQGPE